MRRPVREAAILLQHLTLLAAAAAFVPNFGTRTLQRVQPSATLSSSSGRGRASQQAHGEANFRSGVPAWSDWLASASSFIAPSALLRQQTFASHFVLFSVVDRQEVGPGRPGKRAQRLKDLLLDKELRNDISTAEFALKLDLPEEAEQASVIDYEKLAERLEKNLQLLDRRHSRVASDMEQSAADLTKRLNDTKAELVSVLSKVKANLRRYGTEGDVAEGDRAIASSRATQGEEKEEREGKVNPFTVFVREDGTVDWDGAIQSGKDLAKYSGELLGRLQGKSPESDEEEPVQAGVVGEVEGHGEASNPRASLAAIDATPAIAKLFDIVADLEKQLAAAETERNRLVEFQRSLKKQGIVVDKAQKGELRIAEDNIEELKRRIELQRLDIDMERISMYIEQEVEASTSFREQKLLVAEFGLLDAQLTTIINMLQDTELDRSNLSDLDEDELKVVAAEVSDLKTRLGLVEDPGFKVDYAAVQGLVKESVDKIRTGVSFYVMGAKLLASDLQYASWLISRASSGYTLKPREVRTLQRTAKDLLTLIPFTIILIIPMTPVGHVLVFSLIQRIFPDFFPSTFTDRRQSLSKKYEEIEKKPLAVEGGEAAK